jgi:hypothetical protein
VNLGQAVEEASAGVLDVKKGPLRLLYLLGDVPLISSVETLDLAK